MAFRYEMDYETMSSEMLRKLMGPESNINIKDYILKTYTSMEDLKHKATQVGNWNAKADLSMAYREGIPTLNVEKDSDSAIGWLESSIQSGNPFALDVHNLATLYDVKGTPYYQRKAYEMYLKAARLGNVPAELNLAEMYRCGVEGVVTEDLEEAFKWYRRAVDEEKEDTDDDNFLLHKMRGTMRRLGIDTKIKALTLLHKCYMSGECPEGKPQPKKGLYYLRKAATLGDIECQKELGLTYLTGVPEVPKDLDQAKRWLEKAANHGNIEAKEILEKLKFDQQSVVEAAAPDLEANADVERSLIQYLDIYKRTVAEKNKLHPFLIENPLMFQEFMFTQFPNSPTARNYLKAFRLAKQGFDKLQKGCFQEAIKLMALSYLYENTILNAFPEVCTHMFRTNIIFKVFEELKVNASFFEGLLMLVALYTSYKDASTHNFGSFKIDLKKTMFLENLIYFIEKYESSDRLPKQNPYNFEEDYSSWLHVIYYLLGSHYTIATHYDDGAQAFEKSLKCCPTYYEAKLALAYCLMYIFITKKNENQRESKMVSTPEGQQDEDSYSKYNNKKVLKCSYLRWTQDQLKQKAEQLYLEYLKEAPVCDKKYPNCYYHLAYLYLVDHNIQKAREWKEKGEDAEEKRLPFMEPVSANSKDILMALDMLPIPKKGIRRCSNKECSSKPTDQLKPCPCKEAFYCGRDCQKKDWNEHKKKCSKREKTK